MGKKVYTAAPGYKQYQFEQARQMFKDHDIELIVDGKDVFLSPEEREAILKEADGYILGWEPCGEAEFEKYKNLKIVARFGVGYDNLDVEAAARHGVMCTNIKTRELTHGVAELTVAHMINCLWAIPEHYKRLKYDQEWVALNTRQLDGKTVGLAGFGAIGQEVAKLLLPFGAKVIAWDRHPNEEKMKELEVSPVSFDELLVSSDILSVHIPSLPETNHLFNRDVFSRMKDGAVFINTARGAIVDEEALYEALADGKLAAAGVDVLEKEGAYDKENKLYTLDNFVCTPHIAGFPVETAVSLSLQSAGQVCDALDGKTPVNLLKV